jgi:hypothetical protein
VCSALGLGGGLTPSVSLVRLIRRAHPTVPVMVRLLARASSRLPIDRLTTKPNRTFHRW